MKYLKFENTTISNFEGAIRGMRNPLNSWDKSDSFYQNKMFSIQNYVLGVKDLDLCQRLIKAGPEHRKFLRQIMVCVDITAPRFFWQEWDTYKVGTTENSCSTMHSIHKNELTKDDFEYITNLALDEINRRILIYQEDTTDIDNLLKLKSLLSEGFRQKRTVTLNYENIINMYRQRKSHKLPHWNVDFVKWVQSLDYMKLFLSVFEEK